MLKAYIKACYIKGILRKQVPVSFDKKNKLSFLDAKPLTADKVYCVINFDDLSPLPDNSKFIGRGGSLEDFVSIKQMELLKLFPFIGITHFMIPQFLPSDYYYIFNKQRYSILNAANKEWLSYYKTLAANFNIEFASHGVYHRQAENLLFARHTEFAYLDYERSLQRLTHSISLFNKAGINPIGFRAPGWDMNSDISLVDAVSAAGLKYAGLSSYDGGLNSTRQRISYYHPVMLKGIVNFPDNINIDWPLDKIKTTIRNIVDMNGIIAVKGHFSKHILTNSLSEENFLKLIEIIKFIRAEYKGTIEFATFKDVYTKLEDGKLSVSNNTELKLQ